MIAIGACLTSHSDAQITTLDLYENPCTPSIPAGLTPR